MAAGVAADNVICAIYFMILFALASRIPPEAAKSTTEIEMTSESKPETKLFVQPTAFAVVVSFPVCKFAAYITNSFGFQGGVLPTATALVVLLATLLPTVFNYLAPSADVISLVSMQANRFPAS